MAMWIIKLNHAAVRHYLLGGGGVEEAVKSATERIAQAAGEGMEGSVEVDANRVHGRVVTATPEAMYLEATDRTLSRALDAGR